MRRFFLWCALLLKRLLHRPAYLAILLAVPLLTLALAAAARTDTGLITAAICRTDPEDAAAAAVEERLTGSSAVVRIRSFARKEEALELLERGDVDTVWILGSLEDDLAFYAAHGWSDGAIHVVEREDNVLLMLARETLFAALFPELSRKQFDLLLEESFGETDSETLQEYYQSGAVQGEIIRFETVSGAQLRENHIVSPVRGLLSVLVLLAALASALYSIGEQNNGSFIWLHPVKRGLLPLLSGFLASLPAGIASVLALILSGLGRGVGAECTAMLLHCCLSALFVEALRRVLRSETRFAAAIPVAVLLSLALTPVFADLNVLQPVRWVLPGYWYLRWAMIL